MMACVMAIFYPFWPIVGSDSEILGPDGAVVGYEINNFNFTAPLIVLAFLAFGILWVAWAKKWFKGPKVQGTAEELAAIERGLERGEKLPDTGGVLPA